MSKRKTDDKLEQKRQRVIRGAHIVEHISWKYKRINHLMRVIEKDSIKSSEKLLKEDEQ